MKIEDLLSKRSDLSTFLVHLTRTHDGVSAKERLEEILKNQRLELGAPMGQAVKALNDKKMSADSQRCVCFTETPLENVKFMLGAIEGRQCQFEPYGVAITKRQGREKGINPIWYVDITPGHDWLTKPLNELIDPALASPTPFQDSPVAKIAPFVEQMGTGAKPSGGGYRKEFWWEREWRSTSPINLGWRFLVLCPDDEFDHFKSIVDGLDVALKLKFVDPRWSLEQIIASLAGFPPNEISPI